MDYSTEGYKAVMRLKGLKILKGIAEKLICFIFYNPLSIREPVIVSFLNQLIKKDTTNIDLKINLVFLQQEVRKAVYIKDHRDLDRVVKDM